MTEEKPKSKKINDLEALSTLTKSTNYAIPILDLNDRDADGDPKLKQVPINLLQSLFKTETNLHKVATSGKYSDLKNLPQLFSGNYADLSGKPNIPSRTSELQNDAGFLTQHQNLDGKQDLLQDRWYESMWSMIPDSFPLSGVTYETADENGAVEISYDPQSAEPPESLLELIIRGCNFFKFDRTEPCSSHDQLARERYCYSFIAFISIKNNLYGITSGTMGTYIVDDPMGSSAAFPMVVTDNSVQVSHARNIHLCSLKISGLTPNETLILRYCAFCFTSLFSFSGKSL